jgi:hypothetical protein
MRAVAIALLGLATRVDGLSITGRVPAAPSLVRAHGARCTATWNPGPESQTRADAPSDEGRGNHPALLASAVALCGSASFSIQRTSTPLALSALVLIALCFIAQLWMADERAVAPRTDAPTECYLVDGVEADGRPLYVCTPDPDLAAQNLGVPRSAMRAAAGFDLGAEACEETISFQGASEWVCTGSAEEEEGGDAA